MAKSLDIYRNRPVVTEIMGLSKVRRMPRLGKIHLGVKVPSAKNADCRKKNHPNEAMCTYCSFPKDTDYFVFSPDLTPSLKAKVLEVYGERPQVLDIYFPTNNREQFFPQALMWYKGARLMCKGDGETAMRIDEQSGNMKQMECPCEHFTCAKPDCKARGKLLVMLPKINMSGVWQIDTGSTNNMIEINSACEYFKALLGEDRLARVPFLLKRVPTQIMTPDGKPVTKALLKLEFEGDAALIAAYRQRDAIAALGPVGRAIGSTMGALPPAPEYLSPEEDIEIPEGVDPVTGEVLDGTIEPETEQKATETGEPPINHDTEEPFGATLPPKSERGEDPPPAGKQTTKNFEFLKEAGILKGKVGAENYYRILSTFAAAHANEILDPETQILFIEELTEFLASMPEPEGATPADPNGVPTTAKAVEPYIRAATTPEMAEERFKASIPALNKDGDTKLRLAASKAKNETIATLRRAS